MILSMTSGKRPDLFRRTILSFKKNCLDLDLITEWICIDDQTDAETREKLMEEFPFIKFIFKLPEDVGHAKSLNKLRGFYNNSKDKYFIHLEDDWEFNVPGHFIRDALEILEENANIGQVMFNKNYQETAAYNLLGGIEKKTMNGNAFFIHDRASNADEIKEWVARYGNGPSVQYTWPHFSLQPSVTRIAVLEECGLFDETSSSFEYDYGFKYIKSWITAFLPKVHCEHIGRRLNDYSEGSPLNAYELNKQYQWGKKWREPTDGKIKYSYD